MKIERRQQGGMIQKTDYQELYFLKNCASKMKEK
jgi:hypothetical protein